MKKNSMKSRKRNIKFNEKRKQILDEFEKEYSDLCLHEKACVEHTDRCGKLLIRFKDVVKKHFKEHEKKSWHTYFYLRFPIIDYKTCKRYMDFSIRCDFDQNPALAFMEKSQLYEILAWRDKVNIAIFLKEWGINCDDVNTEDDGAVERLKCRVHDLLFSFNVTMAQADEARREFLCDYPANQEKNKKGKRKEVVMNFSESALSFGKDIDLVLDEKKAVTIEGGNLLRTVRGVQKKLRTLGKHLKSLRKGTAPLSWKVTD